MWEIFSNGQQPYPGMTNAQAREKIEDGMYLVVVRIDRVKMLRTM